MVQEKVDIKNVIFQMYFVFIDIELMFNDREPLTSGNFLNCFDFNRPFRWNLYHNLLV